MVPEPPNEPPVSSSPALERAKVATAPEAVESDPPLRRTVPPPVNCGVPLSVWVPPVYPSREPSATAKWPSAFAPPAARFSTPAVTSTVPPVLLPRPMPIVAVPAPTLRNVPLLDTPWLEPLQNRNWPACFS